MGYSPHTLEPNCSIPWGLFKTNYRQTIIGIWVSWMTYTHTWVSARYLINIFWSTGKLEYKRHTISQPLNPSLYWWYNYTLISVVLCYYPNRRPWNLLSLSPSTLTVVFSQRNLDHHAHCICTSLYLMIINSMLMKKWASPHKKLDLTFQHHYTSFWVTWEKDLVLCWLQSNIRQVKLCNNYV